MKPLQPSLSINTSTYKKNLIVNRKLVDFSEILIPEIQNKCHLVITYEQIKDYWGGHSHDFFEIVFVYRGHGVHVYQNKEVYVQPGDIFIFPPGVRHDYTNIEDLEVFNIAFTRDIVRTELSDLLSDPRSYWFLKSDPHYLRNVLHFRLDNKKYDQFLPNILHIFESGRHLIQTYSSKSPKYQCLFGYCANDREYTYHYNIQKSYFRLLLLDICRLIPEITTIKSTEIESIVNKMTHNPALDWDIKTLSSSANLEPSYFIKKFKKELGQPPIEFLMNLRLEKAASLLSNSSLSLSEIYTSCGFKEYGHFYRRFKSKYNLGPKDFIKLNECR